MGGVYSYRMAADGFLAVTSSMPAASSPVPSRRTPRLIPDTPPLRAGVSAIAAATRLAFSSAMTAPPAGAHGEVSRPVVLRRLRDRWLLVHRWHARLVSDGPLHCRGMKPLRKPPPEQVTRRQRAQVVAGAHLFIRSCRPPAHRAAASNVSLGRIVRANAARYLGKEPAGILATVPDFDHLASHHWWDGWNGRQIPALPTAPRRPWQRAGS